MSIEISYMGTKRNQAQAVSEIVKLLPDGPLLDIFSGMCSVGEAIAPNRQIWTNDVQIFPSIVGHSLFCSQSNSCSSDFIYEVLRSEFLNNYQTLAERFTDYLIKEARYLKTGALKDIIAGNSKLPYIGNCPELDTERVWLSKMPSQFPYRLATMTYVGAFFGAKQCMEIDSLRYSIDRALENSIISLNDKYRLLIVLGKVISRINNSTGQFAQYIHPKKDNLHRIIEKRRRSVWKEFISTVESVKPIGNKSWRLKNCSFNSDALDLLSDLENSDSKPTIVYADPPYSKAQYSRYYHVLDMMVEYRYPKVSGSGRYPDNRYQTPFSHSSRVIRTIEDFVDKVSRLGAILVLSYPENGLYCSQGGDLIKLLKKFFHNVELARSEHQLHSTFGGPRVAPSVSVIENVYIGYN